MQYFTLRVCNVPDIPSTIMKLIDVFVLFVVHIAVFPSYDALSVTFKQVFAYGLVINNVSCLLVTV